MNISPNQLIVTALAVAFAVGCAPSGTPPRPLTAPTTRPVINIAHRGASGHAPEHTLLAYDRAIEMGADYIEQDLQLTKDGVLVVLHDATLDRTARGPAEHCTGKVIEKTLAQLRMCDVGTWFNERFPLDARPEYAGLRIPTLDDVFTRYGDRARYYIETKTPEDAPGMEEALLHLLDAHGLRARSTERRSVLIQSFSPASLRKMHSLDSSLALVQLYPGSMTSALIRATLDQTGEYAIGIGPSQGSVDRALVNAAHARCLEVHPYTVNEVAEMQALLALGADGMFTNFPDRLTALLGGNAAQRRGGRLKCNEELKAASPS